MKYLTIAVSTLIVASFVNKIFSKARNGDDERRRAIKRKLDEKREEFERRRGRPLDALDSRVPSPVLEELERYRYDGPKVAADGCAMGRAV